MSTHVRRVIAVAPVVAILIILTILLSGCKTPFSSASGPPVPTSTPIPQPTATPTPPPAAVYVPAFPALAAMDAPKIALAPTRGRAALLADGLLYGIDLATGQRTGPVTVTASDATNATLVVDDPHAVAAILQDGTTGMTPTLTAVDLLSGQMKGPFMLSALPQSPLTSAAAVPNGAGVLAVFAAGSSDPPTPAEIALISPTGRTRMHALSDSGTLVVDTSANVAIVSGTDITPTLSAVNAHTLRPLWTITNSFAPTAIKVDSVRHRLWLVATGGLVSILDTRTGRLLANCTLTYQRPSDWAADPGLVLDPRTGLGYATWQGTIGSSAGQAIDRINPDLHTRSILTYSASGVLLGVTPLSSRLIAMDSNNNLVLVNARTGRFLSTMVKALLWAGGTGGAISSSSPVAGDGPTTFYVVQPASVPYQNEVTGTSSTTGLVGVVLPDRVH